ncbi:MAG: cytochrome c biogenesis protein ResB [Kiritimatiellae bacterium]|nr:cytochrome c biogenesis protein ResB [Kiritimatiellia bacterium]
MAADAQDTPSQTQKPKTKSVAARITRVLASVPFASVVVALIAMACIVGTLLPQGQQVQQYLTAHPEREGLMSALDFAGLTHVFSALWFVGLLLMLAASLAVCSFKRYAAAMRLHGRPRSRAFGSLITHISMLLVLCGGVVRVVWGERGQLGFREGETAETFIVENRSVPLPFKIRLVKFTTEHHKVAGTESVTQEEEELLHVRIKNEENVWSIPVMEGASHALTAEDATPSAKNTYQVTILNRLPDFVINGGHATSRSDELNNPALRVQVIHNATTNIQWIFALHPGFNMHATSNQIPVEMIYTTEAPAPQSEQPVKDWKSTLEILDNDVVVKEKTIEVNAPLSYKGYTFYQSGYNPNDPKWTSLQVVRDPGVPLVYTGFLFLIVGLTMVFYLYPHGRHER